MEAIIIEAEVIEALRSCFDPEIPVNIYELGLIYDVKVDLRRGRNPNDPHLAQLSGGAIIACRSAS